MRWEEFHQRRAEFLGREIEIEHDGKVYRGSIFKVIKDLSMDSDWAEDILGYTILTSWSAVREKEGWKWHHISFGLYCVLPIRGWRLSDLEEREDGSLVFSHSNLGTFKILPLGDSILSKIT